MKEKLKEHKNKIIAFVLLIIIISLIIILLPKNNGRTPEESIMNYYKTAGENVFIDKNHIVSKSDFKPEITKLGEETGQSKYVAFYEVSPYLSEQVALMADFFWLGQNQITGWQVENYESTYVPYIAEDNALSKEDVLSSLKENVLNGTIKSGRNPEEVKQLQNSIKPIDKGAVIGFRESLNGSKLIELRQGEKYGSNYLYDKTSENDLEIENVVSYAISESGKYLIYSTGELKSVIGQIHPSGKVYVRNLETKEDFTIYENTEHRDEFSLYSNDTYVIIGTEDSVLLSTIATKDTKSIFTFETAESGTEEHNYPEVLTVNENSFQIRIQDSESIGRTKLITLDFNGNILN